MRAAIVTGAFPPSREPVATTVKHLVDEAVRHGHRPLVLAPGVGPASYRGVPVVRIRGGDTSAIRRELAALGPDVVHVADPRLAGPQAVRVARQLGLPTVVSQHSVGEGPVPPWWKRGATTDADLTLATCLWALDRLDAGSPPGRTSLWRPGTDTDLYCPAMRDERLVEHWSRGRDLVVGHVGDVSRPRVVRRLAAIAELPGVRLVVLRAGPGAERFRARVPGAKVSGDLSGVDLAHALASLDVLVVPRRKELDCHTARRALASGVPVVGVAGGGVTDVVADGVNGLVVRADDEYGVPAAVARLRRDPELRARLGSRARAGVVTRTWADAYDELVAVHWASVLPGRAVRTA
ncbi:MAG: glycosyl transferase, group 1 [Nocardioidaceae bacterium]|nr:glycosyl transferase, group 1 [Nocardioidaceae bacterium]